MVRILNLQYVHNSSDRGLTRGIYFMFAGFGSEEVLIYLTGSVNEV